MPSTKTTPTARRTSRRLSFAPEPTNERRTSARLRTPTVGLKLQDDNVQASPDIPTDTPTNRRRSSRRSLVSQAPLVPKLKEEGNLPMPIPKLKLKKCVVNMGSPCKVKEYWSSSEDFKENSTTVDKNKKIKRKRSREVSSKSNLSLEFISDQDAEEITDIKKISSKTISSDEDKDEALVILDYTSQFMFQGDRICPIFRITVESIAEPRKSWTKDEERSKEVKFLVSKPQRPREVH